MHTLIYSQLGPPAGVICGRWKETGKPKTERQQYDPLFQHLSRTLSQSIFTEAYKCIHNYINILYICISIMNRPVVMVARGNSVRGQEDPSSFSVITTSSLL